MDTQTISQLIVAISQGLVDEKNAVNVTVDEPTEDNTVVFHLHVAPDDMGRVIGKQLAAALGIPCYDRTIIQKTSEKSGLSPDFIARAEERARSRFHLSIAPIGIGAPAFTHQGVPVSHQAFFAQAEVIREEARLDQVRRDVDERIAAEERRLEVAQGELRLFIQAVRGVCGKQLELLDRLPELPAAPPAEESPARQEAPLAETRPVPELPAEEVAAVDEEEIERNIQEAVAALGSAPEPAEADPFAEDPAMVPGEDSLQATRVLNLDELQFGRNYKP